MESRRTQFPPSSLHVCLLVWDFTSKALPEHQPITHTIHACLHTQCAMNEAAKVELDWKNVKLGIEGGARSKARGMQQEQKGWHLTKAPQLNFEVQKREEDERHRLSNKTTALETENERGNGRRQAVACPLQSPR